MSSDARPRVVLHVGLPKSGTSFLQASLAASRARLADQGVLYPPHAQDLVFRAALDVRGNHEQWGRTRAEVAGAWDEACRLARRHPGVTVLSHELLAAASGRQVTAALSMLSGLEVHLVVTARDLSRQLVAEWQEGVKHGRRTTFADFERRVSEGRDGVARQFHAAQDLPDVLNRWGAGLPPERVHVVVVGPSGTPRERLWGDFAGAAGLTADHLAAADPGADNASLGTAEIDLLRRVNAALDGRVRQPHYGRMVKRELVRHVLAGREGTRPATPASLHPRLSAVSEQWVKEVRREAYAVHGRLEDLVPVAPDPDTPDPDEVEPRDQLDPAVEAIAHLLVALRATEEHAVDRDQKRRSWKKQTKRLRRRLADQG